MVTTLPASFPTEPIDSEPDSYIIDCSKVMLEYNNQFPRTIARMMVDNLYVSLVQIGSNRVGIETGLGADDVLTLLRSEYPSFTKEDILTVF